MATGRVLTIRIDTNGAQRSASGAVVLDPAWSIPMIQILLSKQESVTHLRHKKRSEMITELFGL